MMKPTMRARFGKHVRVSKTTAYACIIVQLCRYKTARWAGKMNARSTNPSVCPERSDDIRRINYTALHLSIRFHH